MAFSLTPVAAPAVSTDAAEFDAAVASTIELKKANQWASLTLPEADVATFVRKFGEAANRVELSRKVAKLPEPDTEGNVLVTFTVVDKIERVAKPKNDVTLTDGTTPVLP